MKHEYTIIAGLLQHPGRHTARLTGVRPSWFDGLDTRSWFKILQTRPLSMRGARDFIATRIKQRGLREQLTGALSSLDLSVPVSDADVDYAAQCLSMRAKREHIIDRTRWLIEEVKKNRLTQAREVVTKLHSELTQYDDAAQPHRAGELFNQVERDYRHTRNTKGKGQYMGTGFNQIDSTLGGCSRGELWVWGANTGEGKTFTALQIAYAIWTAGHSVAWVPLEMSEKQLSQLLLVRHSNSIDPECPIETRALRRGCLTKSARKLMKHAKADFQQKEYETPFNIWPMRRQATIEDIATYLEGQRYRMHVDFLVIDYLSMLDPVRKRTSRREEINDTLWLAKRTAASYSNDRGLCLFSPHQVSRESLKERERRKPSPHYLLHDLAETSSAERDADVVGWTMRTHRMKQQRQILLGIAKARSEETIPYGFKAHECYASAYIGNLDQEADAITDEDFDPVD